MSERALVLAVLAYDAELTADPCAKRGPYDCDICVGQSFPLEWPKIVALARDALQKAPAIPLSSTVEREAP